MPLAGRGLVVPRTRCTAVVAGSQVEVERIGVPLAESVELATIETAKVYLLSA